MKINLTKFLAVLLLLTQVVLPLRAQTNLAVNDASNAPVAIQHLDKQSAELEAKKIEAEKDMLAKKLDFQRSVIHYIAAYSWVLLVLAFFYFRFRRRQLMHETLRLMVEKGTPLTPELVDSFKSLHARRGLGGDFRTGLILVAVGIGVTLVAGKFGLIVLLIGVAFLFIGLLEKKNNSNR